MSSNSPSALAYDIYASQLIGDALCCSNYMTFYHATEWSQDFCNRVSKLIVCPTHLRNYVADTLI